MLPHPVGSHASRLQQETGVNKVKWLNSVNKVIAVFSVTLFVLSIVATGLAMKGLIPLSIPLTVFSPAIPLWFVIKAIDCCRAKIATRHGFDIEHLDEVILGGTKEERAELKRPRRDGD